MALANKSPEEVRGGLQSWLETKLPGAVIETCDVPAASGMSNLTVLFSTAQDHFVARVAPDGPAVFMEYDLAKEATVMNALAGIGIPVPVVRWVEEDPAFLGAPFLVMERASGRIAADDPPFTATGWVLELSDEEQRTLCVNSLEAMAAVHDADWKALGLGFLAPAEGDVFDADVEKWNTVYDWARAARVIADSGLCACCASDLRGKTPGDDGLIQCTECGAAWRPASPVGS